MALIVGIPACTKLIGELVQHATPARYGEALMFAAGAIPILLPPVGEAAVNVVRIRIPSKRSHSVPANAGPDFEAEGPKPVCHLPRRPDFGTGDFRMAVEIAPRIPAFTFSGAMCDIFHP